VALSVHTEEGDEVGEAQAAIEECRWREEVEYEIGADGDVDEEPDMVVPEIAVDSSSEIPRVDVDEMHGQRRARGWSPAAA
jgi:hypothetical protein